MTTTREPYVTAGGYESRCSRPGVESWLRDRESWADWFATHPSAYSYVIDLEANKAYAALALKCADGILQCPYDKRMQAKRAYQAVLAAVPPGPCAYCGTSDARTIDHVVARSQGGAHALENLARACASCNSSKGNLPLGVWLQSNRPRAQIARLSSAIAALVESDPTLSKDQINRLRGLLDIFRADEV